MLHNRSGQTVWPEGRIRDHLATGGIDTVRFTWHEEANAIALLLTAGNADAASGP